LGQCLYYFPNAPEILRHAASLVLPGGYLFITTSNTEYDRIWGAKRKGGAVVNLSARQIEAALDGFEIVATETFEPLIDHPRAAAVSKSFGPLCNRLPRGSYLENALYYFALLGRRPRSAPNGYHL